jgi:VanZ like family
MSAVPWFVPGTALSMAVALIASRAVAKAFGVPRPLAWAIVAAFGVIASATLTPLDGAPNLQAGGTGTCDLSRIGLAPVAQLLELNDTSLNVALFIPLGIAIGLARGSRAFAALVLASVALPFGIEATQLVAPILHRGCQSADVSDNLTGLVVGIVLGTGLSLVASRTRRGRPSGT